MTWIGSPVRSGRERGLRAWPRHYCRGSAASTTATSGAPARWPKATSRSGSSSLRRPERRRDPSWRGPGPVCPETASAVSVSRMDRVRAMHARSRDHHNACRTIKAVADVGLGRTHQQPPNIRRCSKMTIADAECRYLLQQRKHARELVQKQIGDDVRCSRHQVSMARACSSASAVDSMR